jgi:hypothetical protein
MMRSTDPTSTARSTLWMASNSAAARLLLGADLRPRRAQLVVQHLAPDALGRRDPLVIAGTQVPSRANTTAVV